MPFPVELPPPEDAESAVHTLVAVQPYRFAPAAAALLKNSWPTWQVFGKVAPTLIGRVNGKFEKSAFRPCVPKLMVV